MKEIICICGAGLITILAASGLKKNSPGISILIAVSGGILIIVAVLPRLTVLITELNELSEISGINPDYISVLVKTILICIAGKFTGDFCRDNGYSSLAGKIELAAQAAILVMSLPVYESIISVATSLLTG